jgi:purine nucleoside permease
VFQYSEPQFLPDKRPKSPPRRLAKSGSQGPKETEDLPYKVELWNESRTAIEQVLAITANASIGYSAFYAAARDHFDRYITLRHKNTIVNRWNGPPH